MYKARYLLYILLYKDVLFRHKRIVIMDLRTIRIVYFIKIKEYG